MSRRQLLIRIAAIAALVSLAASVWSSGAFAQLFDAERVRAFLTGTGALGPVVYVLAFAALEPLGVPGAVFVVPASLVWPTWLAVLLSVAGAVGAGFVSYVIARWVAYDWLQARLPERVKRFTAHARERPLRSVILVRLVFFLAAPAHWALGVSGVRIGPLLLGSAIGFTPGMIALVVLGRESIAWIRERDPVVWVALVAVALLAWLAYGLWFRGTAAKRV